MCPSIKSRKGWVWAKNAYSHPHWMIDVSLKVTGRLKHGADGMVCQHSARLLTTFTLLLSFATHFTQAIWFTQTAGTGEGQVFGNTETWNGLGVMLDSFDNDGLVSRSILTYAVCRVHNYDVQKGRRLYLDFQLLLCISQLHAM